MSHHFCHLELCLLPEERDLEPRKAFGLHSTSLLNWRHSSHWLKNSEENKSTRSSSVECWAVTMDRCDTFYCLLHGPRNRWVNRSTATKWFQEKLSSFYERAAGLPVITPSFPWSLVLGKKRKIYFNLLLKQFYQLIAGLWFHWCPPGRWVCDLVCIIGKRINLEN